MILSKESLDIDGLYDKINEKNDIARSTIRGRLSEMVKAGEVKRVGEKFEAIPVEIQKTNAEQLQQDQKLAEREEIPVITN